MKNIQKILWIAGCLIILTGCKKDRYIFTMKSVRLVHYHKHHAQQENLFIKVVNTDDESVLATTEIYPSEYTLPVTFGIHPHLKLRLYKKDNISLQLWGDVSGLIAANTIRMKEYKIIYPIDMEVENESVIFSVMGTWE